jgi:hypothetical protein
MPKNKRILVVRSLQKARPTADNPLSRIIRLMNIPEVAQHTVAAMTIRMPVSLEDRGFGEC